LEVTVDRVVNVDLAEAVDEAEHMARKFDEMVDRYMKNLLYYLRGTFAVSEDEQDHLSKISGAVKKAVEEAKKTAAIANDPNLLKYAHELILAGVEFEKATQAEGSNKKLLYLSAQEDLLHKYDQLAEAMAKHDIVSVNGEVVKGKEPEKPKKINGNLDRVNSRGIIVEAAKGMDTEPTAYQRSSNAEFWKEAPKVIKEVQEMIKLGSGLNYMDFANTLAKLMLLLKLAAHSRNTPGKQKEVLISQVRQFAADSVRYISAIHDYTNFSDLAGMEDSDKVTAEYEKMKNQVQGRLPEVVRAFSEVMKAQTQTN